jgi:hypothetical protein
VAVAVGWTFTQMMLPDVVAADAYPALQAFAEQCEQLPVFRDTPPA